MVLDEIKDKVCVCAWKNKTETKNKKSSILVTNFILMAKHKKENLSLQHVNITVLIGLGFLARK
jgi:hypothetical protein